MENALNLYLHVIVSGEVHVPEAAMLSQTFSALANFGALTATHPTPPLTLTPDPAPASVAPPAPTPSPIAIPTAPPAPAPTTPQAPAPAVPPAPVPTAPPIQAVPTEAPTEAPTYSMDEISRAGAALAQQGPDKFAALGALLQQFNLQAVTQLRPEQMGPFVTALRGLGAKI